MAKKARLSGAFTLIELLVVIAIIAILLAMVVPLLTRVKERSRRIICMSNIRMFYIAVNTYAANNKEFLPTGGPCVANYDYTITLRPEIYDSLNIDSIVCPNLLKPFDNSGNFPNGVYIEQGPLYLISYNYLGGHAGTPWPQQGQANAVWISPQKTTQKPRLPLIVELNTWTVNNNITFAPHGYWGPIHESKDSRNPSRHGIPSGQIGAVGGNVGLMDGTIEWKNMQTMNVYRASLDQDLFATW
jgi:prepilin-type N-terminal cleavage/methylation domain-containing protein